MRKSIVALFALSLFIAGNVSAAWQPDQNNKLELAVAQAILKAKEKDHTLANWFDSAYAYAVFPKVGKGGIGLD